MSGPPEFAPVLPLSSLYPVLFSYPTPICPSQENEFKKLFGMPVVVVPTNRSNIRQDFDAMLFSVSSVAQVGGCSCATKG